jgi:hypothetical protein
MATLLHGRNPAISFPPIVRALLSTSEFLYDGRRQYGFHPVLPTLSHDPLFSKKYSAIKHTDPELLAVSSHRMDIQVFGSLGSGHLAPLYGSGDFRLQHDLGGSQDIVYDGYLPTPEEQVLQRVDQRSLPKSSSYTDVA